MHIIHLFLGTDDNLSIEEYSLKPVKDIFSEVRNSIGFSDMDTNISSDESGNCFSFIIIIISYIIF